MWTGATKPEEGNTVSDTVAVFRYLMRKGGFTAHDNRTRKNGKQRDT